MWADTKNGTQALNSTFESESTEILTCPFQVKSLPVIKSEVQEVYSVLCTSSHLYLITVVDRKISIFKEECSELFWEFETDSNACCISLSDDSCLLLVAEFSGEIHLIHISSKTTLWSYTCQDGGSPFAVKEAFIATDSSELLKLFIFSDQKIVYEFSGISLFTIYKAIENQNQNDIFEDIHLKKFDLSEMFPNCEIQNIFQMFYNTSVIGLGVSLDTTASETDFFCSDDLIKGFPEADWEYNENENRTFQCFDFSVHDNAIKALSTRDGRYVVFLNEKHVLNVMCPFTSTLLKTWNDEKESTIRDFVLNETVDSSSSLISDRKIGLLIMPTSEDSEYLFEIRNFPSFDLIFSMNLSNFAKIADCNLKQDFWCIIDGKMNFEESGRKSFSYLHVKEIFEASAEARLMNLISHQKFLEARKLAEISSIDSEVIYRTKVSCILNNLSRNKYGKFLQPELDNLWNEFDESFKHITDVNFVQSVLLCPLPDENSMKKVLLCVKNWVISHNDIRDTQKIISKVNQILSKLATYEIICSSAHLCLNLKDFLNKDLLNYMISELQNGDLQIACLMWQRHKDYFLTSLNDETIEQILTAIPDSLSSCHLIPFLCEDFLPFLFSKIPSCIDIVAEWLSHRVYLIEFSEKDLWPENGMALVAGFLNVIKSLHQKRKGETSFSGSLSFSSIHKKFASTDNPVGCLVEFSKDLTWLIKLKSQFNCKVPLSGFQNSKVNVMFAVLDNVNISQIPEIIHGFARPYALEYELELDFCLEQYVEKTFQVSYFTWWSWDTEPWEERLIAVTESIHLTNRWVNAALMIVGRASVPWSERVKKLVQKGIECDCERNKEFQIQAKLEGLKEVLLKYERLDFPINNDINLIHVLVNYIFKQNKAEVLEDVKKVLMSVSDETNESNIYFKYLQFALNQNKMDQMMEIFSSLSENTAVTCAKRLLRYIKMYLDSSFLIEEEKELATNMLYTGLHLVEFLKKSDKTFNEKELHILFKCLLKLQKEFDIFMTFSEVSCKLKCQAILETAIEDFLSNRKLLKKVIDSIDRKQKPISSCIFRLYRLGDILLFEREEVMAFLITSCLQKEKYDWVLKLCKELTESFLSGNIAQVLMQVVDHFYQNFRSIKDTNFEAMVNTIYHLNNVAVTYCKEDSLEQYMDVMHLSTFLSSINKITGLHSMPISPEYTMNSYHKWKFYPFYCDEGFQLDCENVTEFVMMAFRELVKQPNDTLIEINFSENDVLLHSLRQLDQHMLDRGQGIAALRALLYYFHMKSKVSASASNISKVHSAVFQDLCSITYTIVLRILSQRRVDLHYAYSLLSILPEASQFLSLKSLVKWCSSDLKRLASVSRIGVEVAKSLQKNDVLSMYENICKKASLLSRSNVRSIPMEIVLQSSNHESNWPVVKDLILTQGIDLPTVYECCSAFQLPINNILTAYLNHLLIESEKKYLNNDFSDAQVTQILEQAANVINYIKNEDLLYNNFKSLMEKISPYSYEFLIFIEEVLHSLSASIQTISTGSFEKNTRILKFLKVYERTSPVTDMEINRWSALYPTNPKLPEIASKRLPFHFFCHENPFPIINPELSANTLDIWLKIAHVLKIPADHLIIIAVKNTVLKYLKQEFSTHIILNPDMKFVDKIDKMISEVKELESSVACISWVANQMPAGGNKVAFASLAVDYAQQWFEQSADPVIEVYNKLVSFKQQSAIERAVHKNNLASDKILSLKQSPSQLIDHLIEEFSLDIDQCVKACKAVIEIGDIIEIDLINKVFLKFIFKWSNVLKSSTTSCNLDESFSPLSLENQELEEDDTDDTNLFRIINLFLSLPQSLFENLLEVLRNNFKLMPLVQRSRLLFCFVSIFGITDVAKVLEWDAKVLDENLIPLLCSVELENLNLPCYLQIFNKCNKTELVQRILSTNFHNPKAIFFCIKLCFEYNIWDATIWEVILRRMTVKDKDFPLQDILQSVQSNLIHMWHSEIFKDAWKCVLSRILRTLEDSPALGN
ncbi:Kinetochore-associated protein 1 like protein [Argiope bruennichi]|uniref:Kinetochore-associated protein 1 like protein n=1 Tax=Argiope bruennichi TaxID=94029 RepID=A0A8T0FZL6_ARGBR|nr:Kinetochore-associated protein 1 like protein [Argiope bruennichi]